MSLQLAVDGQAAQNVPMPEMHSFITAQRMQLARLSRAPALAQMWEVAETQTRVAEMLQVADDRLVQPRPALNQGSAVVT